MKSKLITVERFKRKYPKLKDKWIKISRKNHQVKNKRVTNAISVINSVNSSIYEFSNALDVGCNNGLYSVVASKIFKSVVGIDVDEKKKVIKKANVTAKFFKSKNCFFYNMCFSDYIKNKQFSNDNINIIMAFSVLHHLNDEEIDIMRDLLQNIQLLLIGVHPEVCKSIRPGKPANKLGLYTVKQVKDFLCSFFSKMEIYNEDTRWPNMIFYR